MAHFYPKRISELVTGDSDVETPQKDNKLRKEECSKK